MMAAEIPRHRVAAPAVAPRVPRGAPPPRPMRAPMPAPRFPRGGPLWGTRDAPPTARPGTPWGRAGTRWLAGFQDSRFPGSHARSTHTADPAGARQHDAGELWESGNLGTRRVHPAHRQSGRSMGTNDLVQTVTSHRFRTNDGVLQFVRVNVSGTRMTSRSRLSPLIRM